MTYTNSELDSRAVSIGFAQRKSSVFFAWFLPLVLTSAGALYALPALVVNNQRDAETGFIMMGMGVVFSAIGWLVTAGVRFTKKKPKVPADISRVERALKQHRTGQILRTVVVFGVVASLMFLTPKGMSQEGLSTIGAIVGFYIPIAVALAYWHRLLTNSERYYGVWLQKNQ